MIHTKDNIRFVATVGFAAAIGASIWAGIQEILCQVFCR